MTTHSNTSVSRRTALAGIGVGGLGFALATSGYHASAQDSTPAAMATHPLVGTWIIDRDVDDPSEVPVVAIVTADGGVIDPLVGSAGAWRPTGPLTAAWTLVFHILEGAGGYGVVRSTWDIDEGGDTITGPYTVTIVAPDGTVQVTDQAMSSGTRLPIEAVEMGGTPLAAFPTWTPSPPAEATPSS